MNLYFWGFTTFQILLLHLKAAEITDGRKAVWNVAHMVNAIYQVDYYLDMGANSIEFDIAFNADGDAIFTYHGIPCDCFRSCVQYETFVEFLDYLRRLTTPGDSLFRKELVLLFLDMKVSGLDWSAQMRAGEDIAKKLIDYYWKGRTDTGAYILVSVPSVKDMTVIRSFQTTLVKENATRYEKKIGFDFSGNEDLDMISDSVHVNKIEEHVWQGDGITNCLPRGTGRLLGALDKRDQQTYPSKVYWWTVDRMSTMRKTLRLGVDALITNHPHRLVSVLKEDEFNENFRLATSTDNPWEKQLRKLSTLMGRSRGLVQNYSASYAYDPNELLYNS